MSSHSWLQNRVEVNKKCEDWWKNVLTYPVAKDKQNRKDSVDSSEPCFFLRAKQQIVLTQGKIVLTLPNTVYKGK